MSTIGQRLRHAREFRGLTGEQLDQAARVPEGTAARLECAARANRSHAADIAKLAAALNVRADWLRRGAAGEGAITPDNCVETISHSERVICEQAAVWLAGPEMFAEHVSGTASYVDNLTKIWGPNPNHPPNDPVVHVAWLLSEPDNPNDPSAVSVSIGELIVGHLPRDRAGTWHPILVAFHRHYGRRVACQAEIHRGANDVEGKHSYRIELRVPVSLLSTLLIRMQ